MNEDLQQRLISDLVVESTESLDDFDRDLLSIEAGDSGEETLHRIFRAIHSLKGTSGCLGLRRIERLSHAGENLLALIRDGQIEPNSEILSTLFSFGDALRVAISRLRDTGGEGEESAQERKDTEALIAALNTLQVAALQSSVHMSAGSAGLFSDEPSAAATIDAPRFDVETPDAPRATALQAGGAPSQRTNDAAIRVGVHQLDALMDLVGELVLARNQLLQYISGLRESAVVNSMQRLNIITTSLQQSVMKTRMQPVGNVWGKYPRIVRDLAHELNKRVTLVMEGQDTELDRSVLEAIKDPLTHLLRNAIDHGLETPDRRLAASKPPEGLLRMHAFHENGQVIIEIRDDGAGIDRARVLEKAIERGLVAPEAAARLTDNEVYALLFLPGFSTARQVTNVSGRGVGMDVVKQNVERIGGAVSITSQLGHSTTVRLKIPLTLAIIPALVIRCGGHRFAIAQACVVELVRIDSEDSNAIEYVDSFPVYRLRGNLLPLVHLSEQLSLGCHDPESKDPLFLVVLQAEGRQFGVVVDSIQDTEEIVVKPLGRELKHLLVYSGATIMGDGQVALILDVMGLARRANLLRDQGNTRQNGEQREKKSNATRQVLVAGLGASSRIAIDLDSVARLDEFPRHAVESAGGIPVVQYRERIMPLIFMRQVLVNDGMQSQDGQLQVVVYSTDGGTFGLVVDRFHDIVDCEVRLQRSNRPGLLGSAVLQGKVTDFVDVPWLVKQSDDAAVCSSWEKEVA